MGTHPPSTHPETLNHQRLLEVFPVSALAAHITLSSEPAAVAATRGVREGHRFVLLSLGGHQEKMVKKTDGLLLKTLGGSSQDL